MAVHQKVHEDAEGPHVYHMIVLLALAEPGRFILFLCRRLVISGDRSLVFDDLMRCGQVVEGTWIHHWLKRSQKGN